MRVQITCRCGKTSELDFRDRNKFECECKEKINVVKCFSKKGFKLVVLENAGGDKKWVRLKVPSSVGPISIILFTLLFMFLSMSFQSTRLYYYSGIISRLCVLNLVIFLPQAIVRTVLKGQKTRLISKGYNVIGLAKKEEKLETQVTSARIQYTGKRYSVQF